jgi:hypothetical protein
MSDTDQLSIGELDTEEPACEDRTQALLEADVVVTAEEEDELDRWFEETEADEQEEGTAPNGLGPMGGGFAGTAKPGKRAMRIAARNGLTVTSTKRNFGSTDSDHHISQTTSYAVDMSNGGSPTPQMDRACHQIAKRLGHPEFRAGNLVVQIHHGYRVQLLYRTNIGGNHFNHVHVGMRKL